MPPDDLTADLPAPRDDEPESLRTDIVDELSDHLQCAVRREELRSNSEPWGSAPRDEPNDDGTEPSRSRAYQRVLARFGDPAAVARKLWWDAMWEKVMRQRFTAVMAGIGAAACVAVCFLLWQFVQDSRASQAASLAEMRDFNAKLLAGLQRPADAPPANSEWTNLRIKLVDAESGAPVQDATSRFEGGPVGGGENGIKLNDIPAKDGVLDLGSIPYGKYDLHVSSAEQGVQATINYLIGPGHPEELILRVPHVPHLVVEEVVLSPPEPIDERIRLVMMLSTKDQQLDGHTWLSNPRSVDLVVDGNGAVLGMVSDPHGSTSHAGYPVDLLSVREASPSVGTSLSVSVVNVLQQIDVESVQSYYSKASDARPLPASRLLWFNTPLNVDVDKTSDGSAILRPALTSQFWNALARAEVLAGLRPPPDGMQIVELPVVGQPPGFTPGLTTVSIDVRWRQGQINTLQVVEAAEFAGFDPDSVSQPLDGSPPRWNWRVLVSSEQAELLELAKRIPDSNLEVKPVDPIDLNRRAVATDSIRQRLEDAINSPKPVPIL